jgi:2-amino-4-hydroxy-6-hydroxymethyldihydropteridine diphosphokinase
MSPAGDSGSTCPTGPETGPAPAGWVRAYVGLGANLGDAPATLQAAFDALGQLPDTRLVARSSVYRTAPVQALGPDFYNAVAALDTARSPGELLDDLLALELQFGRERPYRNAPRTLDLDLLLHGQVQCDTPRLSLPHPRAHERAFVLAPLAELAPALVLPGQGAVQALLAAASAQRIERLPA